MTAVRAAAALALVSLIAVAAPPEPAAYFGFAPGADRTLIPWAKVTAWFEALDKESDRVTTRRYGTSTEGRPMIAAWISSPENLKRLERYQQIQQKLADPRSTSTEEAAKLALEGRAIVLITCSIHSTEVASTFSAIEFAWKLAIAKDPRTQQILDNVILILAPSINPDGIDIVYDWYTKTLGTPYEGTNPPKLYQKYIGHDNNRDWYIFSQEETRAVVSQIHNVWHPQIVYDVHQMGPTGARMFVPPWLDPIEPNVDPVVAQQSNMFGMSAASDLTAAGRKGVVVNAVYDFWTPARHYQAYHGGMRILSESASARLATPTNIKPDQISSSGQGYNPRERAWNFLEPWAGGDWRMRDIMDDQLIAMDSIAWQAAVRRESLLRNFYGINQRAAARVAPYAYIVPDIQDDPGATRKMLETLAFGAIEVERASAPFKSNGSEYPAGTYVIRLRQPFSGFAKTLLERQRYPDLRLYPGGPPKRPYDVTAQTLPLLMGVNAVVAEEGFDAALTKAKDFPVKSSRDPGDGAIPASDAAAWKQVTEAWAKGTPVSRTSAGDFAIGARRGQGTPIKAPRVAIYKGWVPNMDEGWTRWIFEQFGLVYESIGNAAVRNGKLKDKFDVIIFADQGAGVIENGYRQGQMPDEYVGGLGKEGAAALRLFAEEGGRLVFFNDATEYAVEQLGLKAKNSLKGVSNRDFYCPGSLLNVNAETDHPILHGMPKGFTIWNEGSPVWEPEDGSGAKVILRYTPKQILASGWLMGEKYLAGKPALVEMPLGKGKVYLFGMRPQYRAQSYLTLKMVFNALLQ